MKKVLSLLRVSATDRPEEDRDSFPRQRRDIERICKEHDLEPVKEYLLDGISGAYVDHSPDFQAMIKHLEQSDISGVVISALDRFFRPEVLSKYHVFKPFEKAGKLLYCDLGKLDPLNEQDQMKIMFWGQMAGAERKRIKYRMMEGKEASRKKADRKSDPLPIFVAFREGRFVYTDEANRVRRAFELVAEGETIRSVAADLGFSSPTALRTILHNEWAIGYKTSLKKRDYGKERQTTKDGKLADGRKVMRDDPVRTPTNLTNTPLVSKEVFIRVQELLSQNTKTWTQRKTRKNEFLGAGLVYCICGKKMYLKHDTRTGKPSYYSCATRWNGNTPCGLSIPIDAKLADAEVWWSIMTYFTDERFLKTEIEKQQVGIDPAKLQADVQSIKSDIAKTDRRMKAAMKMSLEVPEYLEEVKAQKAQLQALKRSLAEAEAKLEHQITPRLISERVQQLKEEFWDFDKKPTEERKRLMAKYIRRIFIDAKGQANLLVAVGLPLPTFGMREVLLAVSRTTL